MIKCIDKAKFYDLAAVTPLVTWLGLGIVGSLAKTKQMLESREDVFAICSQVATILFMSVVIVLLLIRRPPLRKAKGLLSLSLIHILQIARDAGQILRIIRQNGHARATCRFIK